jgi:hypothetical protein
VDHLLFRCPIAVVTWCTLRNSLGWEKITSSIESFQDMCSNKNSEDRNRLSRGVIAGVRWATGHCGKREMI